MDRNKIAQKNTDLLDYNELLDQIVDSEEDKIDPPELLKALSEDTFNDLLSYTQQYKPEINDTFGTFGPDEEFEETK
jgi:hypothetical protein